MAFEQIRCDVTDAIATIVLNRPERLNAFTPQMRQELAAAFRQCDDDDGVRAIVVTGAGRAFCAGADMSGGGQVLTGAGGSERQHEVRVERARSVRPWEMRKPIIAAINGPAVGVGITMTLQWDIRLAAESAKVAFAFVRRGVIPEALSTWLLPRLVGISRAAELLYSGRTLTAREALEYGVVGRVVADADLLPAAHGLAEDIARHAAPVSVAITKRLLWHHLGVNEMERAEEVETALFGWTAGQPDAREGVRAFLEKRDPVWSMRPSRDLPAGLPSRRPR
jgi:enoyl-CoA hydratase/carnithine racemase